MIYYKTSWTEDAVRIFCRATDRVLPSYTSMKLYYLKHYGADIKGIEMDLKRKEVSHAA